MTDKEIEEKIKQIFESHTANQLDSQGTDEDMRIPQLLNLIKSLIDEAVKAERKRIWERMKDNTIDNDNVLIKETIMAIWHDDAMKIVFDDDSLDFNYGDQLQQDS